MYFTLSYKKFYFIFSLLILKKFKNIKI